MNNKTETETQVATQPNEERNVEIIPFGSDERIKLNVAIVQRMIAVPTRSGKIPDATQCMKFIMLCKARHLNPFEGDAYLIGYDTQSGPQFSLITAQQVFLKRAEASEGFNGMESGVIIQSNEGLVEREGDITLDGEILLGGWAKVYRKDREKPFYRRLKLSTFNTGRSRWEKDPAGMIVKCAEADALRTAFPTHLGGLYVKEERPPIDITPEDTKRVLTFGQSGVAQIADGEEAPQKRKRRTKAEMEAQRMVDEQEPKAPPRATPLEGVRNLIASSPISEQDLVKHLISKMAMEPHQKLDNLSDEKLVALQSEFMAVAEEILSPEKE